MGLITLKWRCVKSKCRISNADWANGAARDIQDVNVGEISPAEHENSASECYIHDSIDAEAQM